MKKSLTMLAVLLLFISSVYCGMQAYFEYKPLMLAKEQKKLVIEAAVKEENADDVENQSGPIDREIDFIALHQINEDVVGWIYIPDSSVDYPILIGETDDQYLETDIEGNYSSLGSIFAFADTARDLSDARTILYGHNMRDYQMFGELKRYLEEDFRNSHQKMYIYTENKSMEVSVFSIFICNEMDGILYNTKPVTSEYQNLLAELTNRNSYTDVALYDVEKLENVQSFSLVTCRGSQGTSNRLIISGIVTNQKSI